MEVTIKLKRECNKNMKRRITSIFIVLCMVMGMLNGITLTVSAASSGTCGENLTWTLDDDGVLTISGSGAMYDWNSSGDVVWYKLRSRIKTINIGDGVALSVYKGK